ncbi:MAG: Hsp20/alpha crystallin family protein [Patescibacteria group bacterium]
MLKKKSFFERLTGGMRIKPDEGYESDLAESPDKDTEAKKNALTEETAEEGQLTVDVYQTPGDIVIKTMVAGVRPEDLDVAITRDMVTIRGKREEERNVSGEDYFHKELYWGTFSRTILLPQEVEIEEAEAIEKHGLLIIKLPKIDKDRQARLKVKNG